MIDESKITPLLNSLNLSTQQREQLAQVSPTTILELAPLVYKHTKNNPRASIDLLFEYAAHSEFTLQEWCDALLGLYQWLANDSKTVPLNSALNYLLCSSERAARGGLKSLVLDYLNTFGMEDSY